METIKPRFWPYGPSDALLSLAVFVVQFALFLLPSLLAAVLLGFFYGILCYLLMYVAFLLFVVRDIRVSENGIEFRRILGSPKQLRWESISSIGPASANEVIIHGWLWPLLPAREMTPSLTSRGHYRINFEGGHVYYPPRDKQLFESLVHPRLRSNKLLEPTSGTDAAQQ
jgi:hypothetical protein